MRIIFIILILFSSRLFAGVITCQSCNGSDYAATGCTNSTEVQTRVNSYLSSNYDRLKLYTVTGSQIIDKADGTYIRTDQLDKLCVSITPAAPCSSGYDRFFGKFGVNPSCKPSCPESHPNPFNTSAGLQCRDANNCNQDQSFISGVCVNKKMEYIVQRCIAAAQSNVATVTVPSDGSGPTCSIGIVSGIGTAPDCTTYPGGTACIISPLAAADKTGYQCGIFNGAPVCVSSSETNAIGTTSKSPGSSTTNGTPKSIEEQISELGETTKIIKETTPQTTTTTSVNDASPLKEGQQMDGGAGSSPMPQFTCSNGQFAANLQSCDTTVVCGSDSYVAYGVCIKLPTRTTVTAKDVTVTTTTRIDDSTGQTLSETSSTSSVTTPVKNPSALGTAETQRTGQCDPTAKNYQECVGLITSITDTYLNDQRTTLDTAATTQADLYKTTRQNDINSLTTDGLGISTASNRNAANPLALSSTTCQPYSFTFLGRSVTINCDFADKVKAVLYWFFYLVTIHQLFFITFRSRTTA